MNDRTDEDIARDLLRRRLNNIADRLRKQADRVNDSATRLDDVGQRIGSWSSYAGADGGVQADLVNMLPNLGLGELTAMAAVVDEARIVGDHGKEHP